MKNTLFFLIIFTSMHVGCHAQTAFTESKNLVWDTIEYPKAEYGWTEGMTVPNISIRDVNNKAYKLYDLLEKPLVIDFWFIACKPCIANKKYLKSFYRQYPIEILSISVDDRASTVKKYAEKNEMHWQNVQDDNPYRNRFKLQIGSNNSYPLYMLIGKDKKVLGVYNSAQDIAKLGVNLQELFD